MSTGVLFAVSLALALTRGRAMYWWVSAALAFSWLGDAALAGVKPLARFIPNLALCGMASFAFAHLCYSTALIMMLRVPGGSVARAAATVAAFEAAGMLLWYILAGRSNGDRLLTIASCAYTALLVGMAGLASAAALNDMQRLWPLMLGGILFVISDALIAANWFRGVKQPAVENLIWSFYLPAQILLLSGFIIFAPARFAAEVML